MAADNTRERFPLSRKSPVRCDSMLPANLSGDSLLGVGVLMGLAEVRAGYRRAAAEEMPCFLVALCLSPYGCVGPPQSSVGRHQNE